MSIEQWIEENVKPNVKSVGVPTLVSDKDGAKTYDLSVFVTTGPKTVNRQTQSIYEIGGEFFFGRNEVKNWAGPELVKPSKIKESFTAIKAQDPNAGYIGMDESKEISVVKLRVSGQDMAYSLIDGELLALPVVA